MSGVEHHLCPRRAELGDTSVFKLPEHDSWREEATRGATDEISTHRACSYCGSMHPDDLFEMIAKNVELGPTDKNYKVYVGHMNKFYFQHLSEGQRSVFVTLMNLRQLNIGEPGHFYVLPFFCERNIK